MYVFMAEKVRITKTKAKGIALRLWRSFLASDSDLEASGAAGRTRNFGEF